MVLRRELLRWFAALFFSINSGCLSRDETAGEKHEVTRGELPMEKAGRSEVYVIKTSDRREGVKELLNRSDLKGLS